MTKVVLIEAHPLMRLGLHQMLGALPGNWDIAALDHSSVREYSSNEPPVDLVIFGFPSDIHAGWEVLAEAARLLHPERILLLCDPTAPWQHPQGEVVPNVYGCITKTAPIEVLEAAIRLGLAGGECFPSQGLAQPMHDAGRAASLGSPSRFDIHGGAPAHAAPAPDVSPMRTHDGLEPGRNTGYSHQADAAMDISEGAQLLNVTPRQYEVLTLLAKGYPIKTVSRLLNISTATAKAHASTLYQRLRVNSKGEAVYAARQRGARFD